MVKNSIYNVGYTLANLVFSLISSVYVSRILQPDGIGEYSYVYTFVAYFVSFASLGIPIYGVREIAKVRDKQEEKDILFSELFVINLITSFIVFCVYLLAISSLKSVRTDINLYLRLGLLIAANMLNIDWLYKGEESYGYIAARSIIIKICSLILMVLLIHDADDINLYADITVLASCGNYVCNVVHSRHLVKFTLKNLHLLKHLKPNLILAVSSLFGELYNKVDITMLGMLATDYSVGIYGNAHKIVNIVISCCTAITATFFPRISNVIKNDKHSVSGIVNSGLEILIFLCVPFMFGLCSVSRNAVLLLYGEAFADAAVTINILSSLVVIRGVGDLVCYQLLIALGFEKQRIPANIITTILNIVMNSVLIPIFNENGAALASVLSELFVNGYLYIKMKSQLSFHIQISNAVKTLTSSVLMYIVVCEIGRLNIPLLPLTILSVISGIAIFVATNLVLKNETMQCTLNWFKNKLGK